MKTMLLGLTLTSIVAMASANAADTYVPGPGGNKDGSVQSWAGFYLGANVGFGRNDVKHDSIFFVPADNGVVGGGHIGYNFQSGNFVYGVEADGSALSFDRTAPCANPSFSCHANQDWMATARGRLGYAFGGTLVYGTVGVAFSDLKAETSIGGVHFPDDKSLTGIVIGGGAEVQIMPRWIGRIEALVAGFGHEDFKLNTPNPHIGDAAGQIRTGLSYKLGSPQESLK